MKVNELDKLSPMRSILPSISKWLQDGLTDPKTLPVNSSIACSFKVVRSWSTPVGTYSPCSKLSEISSLKDFWCYLQLTLPEADKRQRAYMLEIVLSQPLLTPIDSIFVAIRIVNVDYDCLGLTTAAPDPMGNVIVR